MASVEIMEIVDMIFDTNGPAKIGLELEVMENDTAVENNVEYLYEFLLNILIAGLVKLQLNVTDENVEDQSLENTLQVYFDKINVNVFITHINMRDMLGAYCRIRTDGGKTRFMFELVPYYKTKAKHISEVFGTYVLESGLVASISFIFK
jgi:hypothetical protein